MDSTNREPVKGSQVPAQAELPHNIQAEQGLLGALLINNAVFEHIETLVERDDFYDGLHAKIFEEIAAAIGRGQVATPVTLAITFEAAPRVSDKLTVPQYLGSLVRAACPAREIKDYASLIHDLATRRSLALVGDEIVGLAFNAPGEFTGEHQIEHAEQQLARLSKDGRTNAGAVTFAEIMTKTIDAANAAFMREGRLSGLSTGLIDLDNKLGGLTNGNLIIIAGRPAMGKTALATNIAVYNALRHMRSGGEEGCPVLFFSMEMSEEELGTRVLGEHASIPSEQIRRGAIKEQDFARLMQADAEIRDAPLYVDEEGGLSLARLAARARREKRKRKIGLLVVDYLQLMAGTQKSSSNRVQEITEITTGLKALAKELEVPIIALSQLSRKVEERNDKRPQLSDLRESGSIEQDADVVLFVFREEYYLERERPAIGEIDAQAIWDARMREAMGKGEVILGKQRHGPTGIVPVAWDGALTKFSNLAREGI